MFLGVKFHYNLRALYPPFLFGRCLLARGQLTRKPIECAPLNRTTSKKSFWGRSTAMSDRNISNGLYQAPVQAFGFNKPICLTQSRRLVCSKFKMSSKDQWK